MEILTSGIIVVAAVLLIILLIKIIRLPLRLVFKLLINAAVGFVGLFVFNLLGGFFNISLSINWLTAIVTGVLGIPGVILLLLIKYLF